MRRKEVNFGKPLLFLLLLFTPIEEVDVIVSLLNKCSGKAVN